MSNLAELLSSLTSIDVNSNNNTTNIDDHKSNSDIDIEYNNDDTIYISNDIKLNNNNNNDTYIPCDNASYDIQLNTINNNNNYSKIIRNGSDEENEKLLTDKNFFRGMLVQDIPSNYNAIKLCELFSKFGEIEYVCKILLLINID